MFLGGDFAGRPAPAFAPGAEDTEGSHPGGKPTGHTKTAQKILGVQKQPPGPTLFLGNLGFETTEDSIRELLESHRPKDASSDDKWIRKIRLGTFEDSGKCKGCVSLPHHFLHIACIAYQRYTASNREECPALR